MKYIVNNFKAGKLILPALTILVSSFFSCTPRGLDDLSLGGTFQIKAKILNPQDSLNLGDSLKVVFEIPDTIFLQNNIPYNISSTGTQTILTDKISCEMGEGLAMADSTHAGGTSTAYYSTISFTNPGTYINNGVRLSKIGNKLLATYYLKPTKKGVFYIASISTGGYFEGNSTMGKIKCRIVFDFDVPNKHHNLLQPAIGVNNNLTPMINEMASHGQGLYVFAVK
jgi:hypothetical protein